MALPLPRVPGRRLAGCLLLLATLPAAAPPPHPSGKEEWPRWRNAGFDGTADGAGRLRAPFELRVRWRRELGSGYSGLVIAQGTAVTMFSDGGTDWLVGLDSATGATRWQAPIGPTWRGIEGANDGPVSTPAIHDGVVYAVGPRGDVLAVDLGDGALRWRTQLAEALHAPTPHWGFGASPLVAGDRLILPAGGPGAGTILAIDRVTGRLSWRAGDDDIGYQSPVLIPLGGRELILAAADHMLFALDPATGEEHGRMPHDGSGFYAGILNPVRVGGDDVLLTYRPDEAVLLRLEAGGPTIAAREQWRTPHLKRNYATPVYHRGHVYGYSGDFLTSIDARDGSLRWKSRPPGNGFPIVVDEQLVVLTKEGTLHVLDASPAAYRERARLDLFPNLAWTPPSFAEGRIFARDSFSQVACVDIAPATRDAAPDPAPPAGTAPGSRLQEFLDSLPASPDRAERIDRFLAGTLLPIVEEDRLVHLIYRGPADDLVVRGDMLPTGEAAPMRRVEGTDLYTFSFPLEPDARINYQFVRDLDEVIVDPGNPRQSDSLVYPGRVSQILMPRSPIPAAAPEGGTGLRGRIESFRLVSPEVRVGAKTWGGERSIHVYLPPGYDDDDRRYPALYVLYGAQMLEGGFARLLDERIGRDVPPLILIFVETASPYEYARSQRHAHRNMVVEQLVPRVDSTYRTFPEAGRRWVLGVDEGGVAALELGLREPRAFGTILAQSVYPVGAGDRELLELLDATPAGAVRVWLDWGRYDQRSPARRIDVAGFNRTLRDHLRDRRLLAAAKEWNDGSDLAFWVSRAAGAIQSLLSSGE